jgi:hypothetical protein
LGLRQGKKPHDLGQKKRFCPLEPGKLRTEENSYEKLGLFAYYYFIVRYLIHGPMEL